MKLSHDKARLEKKERQTVDAKMALSYADKSYSVSELLQKAREATQAEDWFNAHYWATIAVASCSGTDVNMSEAASLASNAWNELHNPAGFVNEA